MVLTQITLLLRELAVLSCISAEPRYLLKIAEMWETLLSLETLKSQLLEVESVNVCSPVVTFLVTNCSIQNNLLLFELLDELEDDFTIEPLSDPLMRHLLAHALADDHNITGGVSNKVIHSSKERSHEKLSGVEEHLCVGTSLRSSAKNCISELVGAPDAFAWFSQNVPQFMQNALQTLMNTTGISRRKQTAAALDICFYVNLLPLCTPSIELFSLLTPLIHQLVSSRIYTQGKAFIGMIVSCIQVAGQIVQSFGHTINSKNIGNMTAVSATVGTISTNILYIVQSVELACDIRISPSPYPIMMSCCVFLLQSTTALVSRLNEIPDVRQNMIESLNNTIVPNLFNLPIEIHAILICVLDQLYPLTSENYTKELYNLTMTICSHQDAVTLLAESNHMLSLARYCASLDALARHYSSISTPLERQRFITSVTLLQQCVYPLMNTCILVLTYTSNNSTTNHYPTTGFSSASTLAKYGSILNICTLVLSLTCGLQQSLGKKSFGSSSLQIFQCCINFVTSQNGNSVMVNISGLLFIKGLLNLSNAISLSSTASDTTVDFQVNMTEQLIGFICKYLTDPHICAELLSETLKAGITSIGCYWKSEYFKGSFANNNNPSGSPPTKAIHNLTQPACYPIAILITQLFVGSMNPNINPLDATTALDGMNQLHDKHNLFSALWFQSSGSWMNILTACLKSLVLLTHPTLIDSIIELLTKLQKSDLSHNIETSPLSQGFWTVLGNETYRIASELGAEGTVISYLNEVMLRYPGFTHLDMTSFIAYVINPITADIAKLQTV